jgi:hypothetical protein
MRHILVVASCLAGLVACAGQLDRPTQTTLTSGRMPRPERQQSSMRTVDSSGFVDNSGMTSDQRGRTEASGMRATETGSENPTGTPGTGTPVPALEPKAKPGADDEPGIGAEAEVQIARFAEARCDWENSCNRVGVGKLHESKHACAQNVRPLVRRELGALDCAQGYDPVHVGMCLTAVRRAGCSNDNDTFHTNEDCRPSLVCAL